MTAWHGQYECRNRLAAHQYYYVQGNWLPSLFQQGSTALRDGTPLLSLRFFEKKKIVVVLGVEYD
jgi:hypothetical protein